MRKTRSSILDAVHETAKGFHDAEIMDKVTMREFDRLCFETFIKQQLEGGRYNNASEVVRAGLGLLEEQEKLQMLKLEELRAYIQAGIDSGPGIPAEDVFARLKAKYGAMTTGKPGSDAGA